jgi:uncharacterized membrane protein
MLFGLISTVLFVALAGTSLHLSMSRLQIENKISFIKYFIRGSHIFALGMIITIITYIFSPDVFVIFGVLHFIGISIILGYFFYRFKWLNFLFAILFVDIGVRLSQISAEPQFFVFGYMNTGISSLDHFPIFPWFGVFLFGMFLASVFYPKYSRRFENLTFDNQFARALAYLGRNTLWIYFLHHPVIIVILLFFGIMKI